MDIGGWLASLGLERYAQAFSEADIDLDVLGDLTAADLAELGVSLGHRKKLLRAIHAAVGEASPAPTPAPAPVAASPGVTRRVGERRHMTVLFCDMVDSTALGASLDPEDMADILRRYHAACLDQVTRWEGLLDRFMGDGALAYFGYPRAQEDDAARAVHAGLGLAKAVGALFLPSGDRLFARVGVASGLVMVGAAENASGTVEIVGDTLNLAARLQTLAEPGDVVVSDATRRLLDAEFSLASLGRPALKGFGEQLPVWRVEGIRERSPTRFAARHPGHLTPFTGRQDEMSILLGRWQQAKLGSGQVVLLRGEAGIGKSRIVHVLEERLAPVRHSRLIFQCSPSHVTSAWYPLSRHLERAAGFDEQDSAAARQAKLEALLALSSADVDAVLPYFAALLSIATAACRPPAELTPQQIKARTGEALLAWVEAIAARETLLVVVEDCHWIDASFKELFDRLVERLQRLPILLVATFRPEFDSGWTGRSHVSQLAPPRLDRRAATTLLRGLAKSGELPADRLEQILDKADGVPLFLEELARMAGDPAFEARAGAGQVPLSPAAGCIPETLHDLLMGRLDQLAEAKAVVQLAAVIGREFSHDVLAKILTADGGTREGNVADDGAPDEGAPDEGAPDGAALDGAALDAVLRRLIADELVFEQGNAQHQSYAFKHALIRDAAYGSLLRPRRQALHARVARVLERHFPATVEAHPEVLAQHFAAAGMLERALEAWLEAGDRAIRRSALVEAAQALRFGLGLLAQLPAGTERDRRELAIRAKLGPALLVTRGYAAAEVGAEFERLRRFCEQLGEQSELFLALRGLWAFRFVRAELGQAAELAGELLAVAAAAADRALALEAHRAMGMTRLYQGEFVAAAEHLAEGAGLYDPEAHHAHAFRYGNDPGVVCLSYGAMALWCLGRCEEAAAGSQRALELAATLDHPFSRIQAYALAGMLHQMAGDVALVAELGAAAEAGAVEHGFPYWRAIGLVLTGWAEAKRRGDDAAVPRIAAGVAAYRATGATLAVPCFLALEAEARGWLGDIVGARALIDEAEALAVQTGEHYYLAEIWRIRGALDVADVAAEDAAGAAGSAAAEGAFRQALVIASRQQARSFELRAAIALARLLAAASRTEEAVAVLQPAVDWFPGSAAGADIEAGRGLLNRLAAAITAGASAKGPAARRSRGSSR